MGFFPSIGPGQPGVLEYGLPLVDGVGHSAGHAASTFVRSGAATMPTASGLDLVATGVARTRAGYGILIEGSRTNKCYRNYNPSATTGWSVDGGTLTAESDATQLAADGLSDFGPNAFKFVPGGSDQILYGGAVTANTNPHSLSVYMRGAAGGESVDIGHRDASGGGFTNLSSETLTTSWVRYKIANQTPTDTDEVFALDCDAGDTVWIILQQHEEGTFCSTPIPNAATGAAAARGVDVLTTPITPSNAEGAMSVFFRPEGWLNTQNAGNLQIVQRSTNWFGLYIGSGAELVRTYKGSTTNTLSNSALWDGPERRFVVAWNQSYTSLRETTLGLSIASADVGAWLGSGVIILANTYGWVRDLNLYRSPI